MGHYLIANLDDSTDARKSNFRNLAFAVCHKLVVLNVELLSLPVFLQLLTLVGVQVGDRLSKHHHEPTFCHGNDFHLGIQVRSHSKELGLILVHLSLELID